MFEWRLLIDIREESTSSKFLVSMSLFNKDRTSGLRFRGEIGESRMNDLKQQVKECFCESRKTFLMPKIQELSRTITSDLGLDSFWNTAVLYTEDALDALLIDTMYTSLPWDLILFKGEFLANQFSVGFNIPSEIDYKYFKSPLKNSAPTDYRMSKSQPQFLHILSNPKGDLGYLRKEQEALFKLIESLQWLEYRLLENPTPLQVLAEFRSGRFTPFVHFSGHVLPQKGLLLAGDQWDYQVSILSLDDIRARFPGMRSQIVFINGCDALWENETEQNMFQAASVANAFIDAEARAIIAPRSRVDDRDACEAAIQIWKAVFNRQTLGAAVRDYRKAQVKKNPSSVAGYSYILYGQPTARIDIELTGHRFISAYTTISESGNVSDRESICFNHELILEAAVDAKGPISPRHIFAALTRRFIVGYTFFDYLGQSYIYELVDLRKGLGAQQRLTSEISPQKVEFTSGGRELLERVLTHSLTRDPDEFLFLQAISDLGDPEILGALKSLDRGPHSIGRILEMALSWRAEGKPKRLAVVLPDGSLSEDLFLIELKGASGNTENVTNYMTANRIMPNNPINRWEILLGLLTAHGRSAEFWRGHGFPPPSFSLRWLVGYPLHWNDLSEQTQNTIISAAQIMKEEEVEQVRESHLIYALLKDDPLSWEEIPLDGQRWFKEIGLNPATWMELASKISLESLGW